MICKLRAERTSRRVCQPASGSAWQSYQATSNDCCGVDVAQKVTGHPETFVRQHTSRFATGCVAKCRCSALLGLRLWPVPEQPHSRADPLHLCTTTDRIHHRLGLAGQVGE